LKKENEYKLIEKTKYYKMPVGSVITDNGKKILYRNINDRHILDVKGYKRLFVDNVVIDWLSKNEEVDQVVFDFSGKEKIERPGTLSVSFDKYLEAKPIKMAGRLQRGLALQGFEFTTKRTLYKRPNDEVVIQAD